MRTKKTITTIYKQDMEYNTIVICLHCRRKICNTGELCVVREKRVNDMNYTLHSFIDVNAMSRQRSLIYLNDFIISVYEKEELWKSVYHKCSGIESIELIGHFNVLTGKIYLSGSNCGILDRLSNISMSLSDYRGIIKNDRIWDEDLKFMMDNFIYEKGAVIAKQDVYERYESSTRKNMNNLTKMIHTHYGKGNIKGKFKNFKLTTI